MDLINSQELNYIMNDLGPTQQFLMQGNEQYVDMYNPAYQQHVDNGGHLLQEHEIKSENQSQQHLTDGQHLQEEQHLNNGLQQHELTDSNHLQQQHLNGDYQQQLTNNVQLQQHHLNDLPPQQQLTDMQQHQLTDQGEVGGEMLPPPPAAPPPSTHTSPTGVQPCLATYPGEYDFQVTMANTHNGRHAWVYSTKLQKIFIDIDKVLMLQFRLNTMDVKGLYVRVLLVYSDPDHAMHAVNRCTLHVFKCDPNGLAHADTGSCHCSAFQQCGHVVTSDHPLARYEWNAQSGRHSVLVPLGSGYVAPGQEAAATVAYQFGCKTSCSAGMSRRPVRMVFTLETNYGDVLGRSTLAVKICSCPKRDKDREESGEPEWHNGGHTKQPLQPATKKRKLQHHISGGKVPLTNEVIKDTSSLLFEEVKKLNEKFDLLNSKVEEMFSFLQELASSLGVDNSSPNKNNGYTYDP